MTQDPGAARPRPSLTPPAFPSALAQPRVSVGAVIPAAVQSPAALPVPPRAGRTAPIWWFGVLVIVLVGNAYGRLARRTSPGAGRHNARTAACDWYARSDAAFEAMRQRGKLTGAFIPDAEAVRAELTRCGGERGTVPSPGSITR